MIEIIVGLIAGVITGEIIFWKWIKLYMDKKMNENN